MAALSFDGVTMSQENPDLHGNAPDNSTEPLLLIDVINDLEFAACDAHLRDYHLVIPKDSVVSQNEKENERSLELQRVLDADSDRPRN